jgi:hypothetical protein
MTSPSGVSTNFEFSADKLAGFVDPSDNPLPLYYYLGAKPLLTSLGKKVLIGRADLPSLSQDYFRLIKRPFTRLQVLLPGETSAPGTATGKTGTPTPQNVSVPFDVVVYAVDDTWHRINLAANDTVSITCTDETATLPAEATLVGGARTFSVTMGAEGTFTITASDTKDTTKKAGTSSQVTINP